jgi:hypothetical protein
MLLALLLYLAERWKHNQWDKLDVVRMLIPPFAFVAWTMLQKATAFDALSPGLFPALGEIRRTIIALVVAAILGTIAKVLSDRADQKPVTPNQKGNTTP